MREREIEIEITSTVVIKPKLNLCFESIFKWKEKYDLGLYCAVLPPFPGVVTKS